MKYLSHYYRYLWQGPELIVITGDATKLWQGLHEYEEKYHTASGDKNENNAVKRLLAGAGLAAVSLPERESWGWTLSLPESNTGLFCGLEPEGMASVSLRQSVADSNAAVVQRQKEKSPLTQSHFTLQSTDPVKAVEQYFEESVQMLVRVVLLDDGRGALVQPMPGHDFGPLDGLSDVELVEQCFALSENEKAKLLDEVVLFYGCRCSDAMILDMITSLPAQQRIGLWQGSSSLTINCPRCNRPYTISKTLETS